jgi:signal transduction histidine kinase
LLLLPHSFFECFFSFPEKREFSFRLIFLTCAFFTSVISAAPPGPLTQAQQILSLTEEQAQQHEPVQIQGVVTAADSSWNGQFFVQDASGGVFVDSRIQPSPLPGDVLRVTGVTAPGAFAPIVTQPRWQALGSSRLPYAKSVSIEQLITGSEDGQRVRVEGWVHTARKEGNQWICAVVEGTSRVDLMLPRNFEPELSQLVGAKMAATGVPTPKRLNYNLRRLVSVQLWLSSPEDFRLLKPATPEPRTGSPTPINSLSRYSIDNSPGKRFFVKGVVTLVSNGTLYVSDPTGGLEVRLAEVSAPHMGDEIEVVGFPILQRGLPVLVDAIVFPTGRQGRVEPKSIQSLQQLQDGFLHGDWTRVEGQLVNLLEKPSALDPASITFTLAVKTPEGVVTAEIKQPYPESRAQELEIGSQIAVEGICYTQTDYEGAFQGFFLLVPSLEQVTRIHPASPFTALRLAVALAIALLILLGVSLWGRRLLTKNLRLQGDIRERNAVLAERSRLAADLHDTLEQSLVALSLQLKTALTLIPQGVERAMQHLEVAKEGITQTHAELRRSIWNLTPEALQSFNLAEAITRNLKQTADSAGLDFHAEVQGDLPPLETSLQQNLLRIAQEAGTNAMKHASASRLELRILFSHKEIVLSVADDGVGLEKATTETHPDHGFGIRGMQERATRIGGVLQIEKVVPRGTRVVVTIPISSS